MIKIDSVVAVHLDSTETEAEFDSLEFSADHDTLFSGTDGISVKIIDSLNYIHNADALSGFISMVQSGKMVSIYHLGDSHIAGKALPAALAHRLHTSFGEGTTTIIAPKIKPRKKSKRSKTINRKGSAKKQPSIRERKKAKEQAAKKKRKYHSDAMPHFLQSPFAVLTAFNYSPTINGDKRDKLSEAVIRLRPDVQSDIYSGNPAADYYGVELRNFDSQADNKSQLNYTSFGVNGKSFRYFADLPLFATHLHQVKPQLIIISLGVNDIFGKYYNREYVETSFNDLINRIRNLNPTAEILLTFSGDAYIKKRKTNPFLPLLREHLIALAKENNCAWWDPAPVFGGYGYMNTWFKKGLSGSDKIHLTKAGYSLFAEKLGEAILKSLEVQTGK